MPRAISPSVPTRKAKPHPGAHRLLHPDPTRCHDVRALACQACGADVSDVPQSPCAVYRKISNGFRQEWGAHLCADIRSVIKTARRRSVRAIEAIRDALNTPSSLTLPWYSQSRVSNYPPPRQL